MSRKTKMDEFKANPSCNSISLSTSLLECSFSELDQSLHERQKEVIRLEKTHYSSHAIGSIILLVTGFDAWLNEGIGFLGSSLNSVGKGITIYHNPRSNKSLCPSLRKNSSG